MPYSFRDKQPVLLNKCQIKKYCLQTMMGSYALLTEKITPCIVVDTISVSRRTATTIQGFGNLCVKPQGLSSCPSADGTELFYRKPGQCQGASTKFLLSPDGVLRHHCSRKKICPKGGQGGYGVPLVISGNCDKEQSKFERTTRRFSLKILIERLSVTSVTHSDTDWALTYSVCLPVSLSVRLSVSQSL